MGLLRGRTTLPFFLGPAFIVKNILLILHSLDARILEIPTLPYFSFGRMERPQSLRAYAAVRLAESVLALCKHGHRACPSEQG